MKFFHLSDLHLGIRINEFSMLEDQRYILDKIICLAQKERPDCVFIAGDIYDKSVPPAEAVSLFDGFVWDLYNTGAKIFIIGGNHDSQERLSFGSRVMTQNGIHIAPVFTGGITPVKLCDEYGDIMIYQLPFIRPAQARPFFPESRPEDTEELLAKIIENIKIDTTKRNILLAHLFAAGSSRCDSEDLVVGGADCCDTALFSDFDYTALGHLHGPQAMCGGRVRYCGTPLKYSFSEVAHRKTVSIGELHEKGTLDIREEPLVPMHDMREIRGSYDGLVEKSFCALHGFDREDYLHITLTDEDDVFEALARLRTVYPNIMKLDYDNQRTRTQADFSSACECENRSPLELASELFEKQNGQPLSQGQAEIMDSMIKQIWSEAE